MVDIHTVELSFKRIPEYNAKLAKTVPSSTKTNYLVGSIIAIGIGLFTLLVNSQSIPNILGGSLAVGGVVTSIYILQRTTDDSSEAQEERKKFHIAESIHKAKINVKNEQVRLTNAAHSWHSFGFDTTNTIGDRIAFNSYTVKVTDRPDSINIGLRIDKILYRTEFYTEFYTAKQDKLKSRQCKRKIPDRIKFTIAFPTRKRAVKGIMPFDSYNQMVTLYNARHQKAQELVEFSQRYAIAEENIRKHGDRIYFSPEEKKAIEDLENLASFDLRLNQIGKEVAIVVDESKFAKFDQKLGLESFSGSLDNKSSDDRIIKFTDLELKAIGLPTIRKQFNITARSYNEAITKLNAKNAKGITVT
ncbi:hypothetical protein [Pseudanabaena minima]|uniref:hypothetical protein n=1 Tax=Pseudanabaena minima TaxID=890415 RepID=UPI003DA92D98